MQFNKKFTKKHEAVKKLICPFALKLLNTYFYLCFLRYKKYTENNNGNYPTLSLEIKQLL